MAPEGYWGKSVRKRRETACLARCLRNWRIGGYGLKHINDPMILSLTKAFIL